MHCFIYRYTVCNILLYCTVPRTMHATMQNIYCFPLCYNCTTLLSRHALCFANMFCVLLTCLHNMFCVLTKCFIRQNLLYNIVVQHLYNNIVRFCCKCDMAFTQNVESLIHWKKFTIMRCLNVLIEVFYVLHKVVNLLIMVETVIIHLIICHFHLLYCAICKSLYNMSVFNYDCNVIKSLRTIVSVFKYYYNN